jgi:predicted pyridoxine 5'-phosphate oxidase superfamily flavin-nucleotide-binding protein
MSDLYAETHRAFQDEHGTRRLADRLESLAHAEFDANDRSFIESAAMFFLATVDSMGRPTVSYKGGAPGFVRIVAPNVLVFPVYDGNGMFLSLGNISGTGHVAMLFIDFAAPRRLRVQGDASIVPNDGAHGHYAGAQHLVRVTASQVFVNCGRYIHRLQSGTLSPHLPDAEGRQPFPEWKRLNIIADSLSERDQTKVAHAGGPVAIESYRGEDSPDGTTTVD